MNRVCAGLEGQRLRKGVRRDAAREFDELFFLTNIQNGAMLARIATARDCHGHRPLR